MSDVWHNNLDSVYNRPPKMIGEAIECYIEEAVHHEDGALEELKHKIEAQTKVLSAMCTVLDPVQKAQVARILGFKPGSNGGGN